MISALIFERIYHNTVGMEMHHILLACMLLGAVFGQSVVEQAEDGSSGSIKFSTPDLNDEEAHSPWMPDMLKCDACRVVALQVSVLKSLLLLVLSHFQVYNAQQNGASLVSRTRNFDHRP